MRDPDASIGCSRLILFLLLIMCSSNAATGQEVADTEVTEPKTLMIETGAVFTSNDPGGQERVDALSFPVINVRTGLQEQTELQVGWSGYQWEDVDSGESENGTGDASVAVKQILAKESITTPRTAVLVGTSIPAGNDAFSSDRFDPVALGIFEYSVGASYLAQVHAGVEWASSTVETGDRDTAASGVYAAAVHYEINPTTEVFLEGFGNVPINADGTPAHTLDVGVWQSIGTDYEFSAWYGRGLTEAADDHLLATELIISF